MPQRKKPLPPIALLQQMFTYNPDTGQITRKSKPHGSCQIGEVAGTVVARGYIKINFRRVQLLAHRLAFALMEGRWPGLDVDHRDGDPSNNRWENLREVTVQVNAQNRVRAQQNSKTGLLGTSWNERDQNFVARIKVGKKYLSLGAFDTAEAAHLAYVSAKRRLHEGCTI